MRSKPSSFETLCDILYLLIMIALSVNLLLKDGFGNPESRTYHLAGFMTILEKRRATQLDTRPIVLCGITERVDENNPLSSYLSKMKNYGRDL